MKYTLDFSLVPDLKYGTFWLTLDEQVERALSDFPQTLARAHSSIKFCWFVSQNANTLCCKEGQVLQTREAFLRASLAEFVAMEETLERDLRLMGINQPAIRCNQTSNPLLHIIRELRNFEIHLHSSKLTSFRMPAMLGDDQKPEEALAFEANIWIIDDLTETGFKQLRNAARYTDRDIIQLLAWFNNAQKVWGIRELIFRAVHLYCDTIISRYRLTRS